METWLLENGWPIIFTAAGVVGSYSLLRYRIGIIETKVAKLEEASIENQVLLATIQKDIEYIKVQVSKLVS